VVAISTHNTKVYKISKFCKAIFSGILQHFTTKLCNFTHLYALSSRGDLFASPCLVLKLVYNGNCLFMPL
jgi:hypothetical protein